MNSSELLRDSAARPHFYELDPVSDENSRRKLQNVVVNRSAQHRLDFEPPIGVVAVQQIWV